jgi:hypothetical protein
MREKAVVWGYSRSVIAMPQIPEEWPYAKIWASMLH